MNNNVMLHQINMKLLISFFFLQHVFEYFTERTPRSHFEHRETSFVWNYKYAGKC